MQEAENGRALSEGTVLCSEDRIPIGRIEDIFGPVMCPLYLLRWAGQGDTPASLVAGAHLFTTQKLAEFLLPEQLYTKVRYHFASTCCLYCLLLFICHIACVIIYVFLWISVVCHVLEKFSVLALPCHAFADGVKASPGSYFWQYGAAWDGTF